MVRIPFENVEIDSCSNCFAAWFDANELPRLLKKLNEDEDAIKNPPPDKTQFREPQPKSSHCPKCNLVITPRDLGDSGISLLKCSNCGGICAGASQINELCYWYHHAREIDKLAIHALPKNSVFSYSERSLWKSFLGLVEDDLQRKNFPWTTTIVILLNAVAFIFSYLEPLRAREFLLVPEALFKYPYENLPTVLTSMFLHAGVIHLAGNMYFLWIFGDNVEDRIGPANYAILYLSSGIIAYLVHAFFTNHPEIPTLGASGAVSGIMGAYLVLYPRTKLRIHLLVIFKPISMRLPVWFYLGIWFLGLQLLNAYLQVPGVAWYAHIGGFLFGFFALAIMKKSGYW
ncbi:MAG: rhomboid family intramembrane serine protease [Desulfobacterales bacterium]|nr:MAG: rhomboid family intramembrane serine protease [Desulfobacterales bacterium]